MKVEIDDKDIQAEMERLKRETKKLPDEIARKVLPRVAKGARTELSKAIRKTYAVKSADVNARIEISTVRRSRSKSRIDLVVKDGALPLGKFGNVRESRTGLRVTVRRGKRSILRNTFLVNKKAMKRMGPPRLPIRPLFGPSVVQMSEEVWESVFKAVSSRFHAELGRQMERHFRRLAKRGLRSTETP